MNRYYVKVIDKHKVQLLTSFGGAVAANSVVANCNSDCGYLIGEPSCTIQQKSYNQNDVSYIALPVSAITVNTAGNKLTMKFKAISYAYYSYKYYNYFTLNLMNHNESYLY